MDLRELRGAIQEKRKKIQEEVTTLALLKTELDIQEALLEQLEQSNLRMEEIHSRGAQRALHKSTADSNVKKNESTSGPDIVNNELLMEKLLGYVAKDDLLNSRLVSKRWNQEVVHFLTKTSITPTSSLGLHRLVTNKTGPRTIDHLHILLENSQHPELLIYTLKLDAWIVENFNSHSVSNVKCEQILRVFGHHVRRLIIEDDKGFHVLSRCLGVYGYCPNLHVLKLTMRKKFNDDIPFLMEHFVRHLEGLQLKKLQFEYATNNASLLKVFLGLLENSPDIEHLFITGESEAQSYPLGHRFLEILQSQPEIARKLKGFQLEGRILENFPTLCKIQFGSNLKRIYLHENYDLRRTLNDGQMKGLAKFLRMVSPTLETLDLFLWYTSVSETLDISSFSSLPLMPKLVTLMCQGLCGICYFLKNSPSLKTLVVDVNEDEEYDHLMKSYWEEEKCLMDGSVDIVPRLIHKGLECIEVTMGEPYIKSPSTIRQLNVAFPNLSKLNFCPNFESGNSVTGHQDWFESVFLYVSQMKQLKDLELELSRWSLDQLIVDLKGAFSNLKDTPNLVQVRFLGLHENEFRAKSILNSLVALVGAPKLRRIRFKCSDVGYLGEEMNWDRLIAELAESNIHLEVQNKL